MNKASNYKAWVEKLRVKNKIRSKFKKERINSCTFTQRKLYSALKQIGIEKHFKPALEREIYTKDGVRFSDIYIKKYGLDIEIDGGYHLSEFQKADDSQREKEIWDKKRIITVRFTNEEIINDFGKVINKLCSLMDEIELLPNWKSPGKGRKKFRSTMERKEIYKRFGKTF